MAATTPSDRVRAIATTVSEPQPAAMIADEAIVSKAVAREHLNRLVEAGVLVEQTHDETAVYEADPEYILSQVEGNKHDIADLRERVTMFRERYDADSPAALREQAAEAETPAETQRRRRAASDWALLRWRLCALEEL